MSVTIKSNVAHVKNGDSWISMDLLGESATSEQIQRIENAGQDVVNMIPDDYRTLTADSVKYVQNIEAEFPGLTLLSMVSGNVCFVAGGQWTDKPVSGSGVFLQRRYSPNYNYQIFIDLSVGAIYNRIVNRNDYTVYRDWARGATQADINTVKEEIESVRSAAVTYPGSATAINDLVDKYNGILANVNENLIFYADGSSWHDTPGNVTNGLFINAQYSPNYDVQTFICTYEPGEWVRIVSTSGEVYRDWRLIKSVMPLKILALGDSICRGVRNGNKGFVGDIGFPYVNIGVSGATLSNVVGGDITNIPDQLVNFRATDTTYSPDVIIANGGINDYFKGANMGVMPTQPAVTDEQKAAIDRSTMLGGCEYLFAKMIEYYPRAQRFFVIVHKICRSNIYCPNQKWGSTGKFTQKEMHDKLVELCEIYGVKVIDVYKEGIIDTINGFYVSEKAYSEDHSVTNNYYVDSDGLHPLALGYKECYVPLVKAALEIGTAK